MFRKLTTFFCLLLMSNLATASVIQPQRFETKIVNLSNPVHAKIPKLPHYKMPYERSPSPTVNISAIRSIYCDSWIGSGFLIGDHVMATALHVAKGTHCVDADTGTPLTTYKVDTKHDLALMTGADLPTDVPYIKVGCSRFTAGTDYFSWGRTFSGMDYEDNVITRMNTITATANYTNDSDRMVDGTHIPGMRVFEGAIAAGMSGGPVTNKIGYALALNNAGTSTQTVLYEFADGALCNGQWS